MCYSSGFLLKNGRFRTLANSPEIDTNSPLQELEIHLQGSRSRFKEFGAISRTYQNPPCSKLWVLAQDSSSKTVDFGPLRIHRKSTQTVPQELKIHLQGCRSRFKEFGAISRTYQNPPCSKPWAIAQAFCSKTVDFGHLRIRRKSTQTVPPGVRNPFARV